MQERTRATIASLADMPDEAVIATAHNASHMANCAFVIRGACAHELISRQPKLTGGRGKRDTEGVGRKAYLARLAELFGIEPRTLRDDLRIYKEFFAREAGENGENGESDKSGEEQADNTLETALTCYTGLGREHFRAALTSPDPQQTIQVAVAQAQQGDCSVQALRASIQADKEASRPSEGLVFEPSVEAPLSSCVETAPMQQTKDSPAPDLSNDSAPPDLWREALGEEAADALSALVTQHNADKPDDQIDETGYLRQRILSAARGKKRRPVQKTTANLFLPPLPLTYEASEVA